MPGIVKIPVRQIVKPDNTPPPVDYLKDGQLGFIRTATILRMYLGSPSGVAPRELPFTEGTVTQVGLSMPAELYNGPLPTITGSGTLTPTLKSQAINLIFASPASGGAGTPSWRSLVIEDFGTLPRLDQWDTPVADIDLNGQKLLNVGDPVAITDGASWGYVKDYIDQNSQGIRWKEPVRVATTGNITLAGAQTIDDVNVIPDERTLVKDQLNPNENGIYIAAAGAWVRANDADTWDELISATVTVSEGTANGDKNYNCTVDEGGTLETTPISFVEIGGAGDLNAGDGLIKSGQTFSAVGTPSRILVGASGIDIDPNYAGQATITVLGAVTQGTWNATEIGVAYGGTGATTAAGARTNLGLEIGSDIQAWSSKLADIADTAFNDNEILFHLGGAIVGADEILSGDPW